MSWTEEKVSKLKELWGKGQTASQIAEIIGGITRNAVIGKAHRLNLASKVKSKRNSLNINNNFKSPAADNFQTGKRSKRSKFKSLLLSQDLSLQKILLWKN